MDYIERSRLWFIPARADTQLAGMRASGNLANRTRRSYIGPSGSAAPCSRALAVIPTARPSNALGNMRELRGAEGVLPTSHRDAKLGTSHA
jgi:hypothetical protein